jgi:hypothetical protein
MNQEVMMSILGDQRVDSDRATSGGSYKDPITPWRLETDPFAGASPLVELSVLASGLPDDRDAEEILRDLQDIEGLTLISRA